MNESSPGRIFISYRRQDTRWPAGRLYDALVQHFPAEQVFVDVDSIEPGEDFIERITATVSSCDVLLALIGPQWLTVTNKNGQRRLDDPKDVVRLEIETALTRKIRVIPILVEDTPIPVADQLPATLAPLVRRNAVEIDPETFDTRRLIAAVQKTLAEEQARRRTEEEARQQAEGWWGRRRAVAGTSLPPQIDAAADLLAARTLATWSQQVVQRGIQAPAPVRVRWQWAAEDVAAPRHDLAASPSLPTDPDPLPPDGDDRIGTGQVLNSGLVTRLHDEVYARLRHGRLMLIGGPGAGKTGAMVLLLLEALRHRERVPDAARTAVPVPVWLTLGSWDPRSQGLRDWVTATIGINHPYLRAQDFGPDAVPQLFDTGRIALFLDGLDEMPDMLRGEAVERLTAEATGRRVVITSRPGEFRETVDTGQQIPYTAVVELRPVGSRAAARYLLEGQIGATRQAWQDVADRLLAQPEGVLARTLNTPLTLSLARSAYAGGDPRELLTHEQADEQTLRGHLLEQVLVAAYPDPGERAHASHWLGWLAHHMNTQPSGPTRDLSWWQIPGWVTRWQVGLAGGLTGGLVSSLMVWLVLGLWGWLEGGIGGLLFGLMTGLVFGPVGGLVTGLVSGLGVRAIAPRSITLRRPTRRDLGRGHWAGLKIGRWVGLLAGLGVGLWFGVLLGVGFGVQAGLRIGLRIGLMAGLMTGLMTGLVFGLVFGLLAWLIDVWRIPLTATSDATPRSVYQRDMRNQLVGGLMGGLACVLGFGLLFPLALFALGGTLLVLRNWLMIGVLFGPMVGLLFMLRGGAAVSLVLTEIALSLKRRRVRFMQLLERALDGQVLRQAGAVYQFRHADLQDRLADRYEAGEARRGYLRAAAAGHTEAMVNLGNLLANRVDPPELGEARRWYLQAATAGHTEAMVNLGYLLAVQLDPPELEEARRWYLQAATAGHTRAMNNLGVLLADLVDPPELDEARRWLKQAATAGHTEAMVNLGYLLAQQADPPELDEARRWLKQAATAGNTRASHILRLLDEDGTAGA